MIDLTDKVKKFGKLNLILKQSNQKQDNINIDHIILKPSVYSYIRKDAIDSFPKYGLLSPIQLIRHFPDHKEYFYNLYKRELDCPILKKCIFAFFARVPIDLPNTKDFIEENSPIRISLYKLKKSDIKYIFYGYNFPESMPLTKLSEDDINKLVTVEDVWYKYFQQSKDKHFRDFPQLAIYSEEGIIPSFVCRNLSDPREFKKDYV